MKPLLEAIIPYRDNEFYQQMLHALAREFHIDLKKPFKDLPEDVKEGILRKGFGRVKLPIYLENGREIHVQFRPVLPEIERRIKETASEDVFNWYYRYVEEVPCDACGGARLRPEALWVEIDGLNIYQVSSMDFKHFLGWLQSLHITGARSQVAQPIMQELIKRVILW